MKKSIQYAGIAAATLLAVAPLATPMMGVELPSAPKHPKLLWIQPQS